MAKAEKDVFSVYESVKATPFGVAFYLSKSQVQKIIHRADQVAIARNIAEQLAAAYNGTDLTAAVEAFAKLYQERKEMDFCNPTEWEGEEGNIYNAIEETPEEVWEWLETLYEDEMEYLNNIIEG